CSNGVTSLDFW
nr:immunoglobulin heavy chain junction region [Macaca mulatta]